MPEGDYGPAVGGMAWRCPHGNGASNDSDRLFYGAWTTGKDHKRTSARGNGRNPERVVETVRTADS